MRPFGMRGPVEACAAFAAATSWGVGKAIRKISPETRTVATSVGEGALDESPQLVTVPTSARTTMTLRIHV
jgi:hypothetical protein